MTVREVRVRGCRDQRVGGALFAYAPLFTPQVIGELRDQQVRERLAGLLPYELQLRNLRLINEQVMPQFV